MTVDFWTETTITLVRDSNVDGTLSRNLATAKAREQEQRQENTGANSVKYNMLQED